MYTCSFETIPVVSYSNCVLELCCHNFTLLTTTYSPWQNKNYNKRRDCFNSRGIFYTSVYFFEKKTWFIWIGTTLKSPNENFATNFKLIANSHVFARIPRWPRLKLILLTHISVYLAFVKTVEKPAGKRIWRQRPNSMVLSSCQNVWNYFSFFNFKSLLWWHVVQDFSRLADTWPLIPQESHGLPRRVGRP